MNARHPAAGWFRLPSRGRRAGGASTVELALLLPIIMAIIFGIVEYGFLIYDQAMITNAAREAARLGVVFREPRLDQSDVNGIAQRYCAHQLISIEGGASCSVSNNAPANTNPLSGGTVPASGSNLTVSVEYTYNGMALLRLYQVMAGPITLRSTAVMKYE